MRRPLVAAVMVALAAAPVAHAGGTPVAVAAGAGRVWAVDGNSVVELDAASGRVLHRVQTRYGYATDVAVGGRGVWASSVAAGYTAAAVTRVPVGASRGSDPLVLPRRPVFSLAAGARAAWALAGPWQRARIMRVDLATGRVSTFPAHGARWLAGDGSAVVAATADAVLTIADDGAATRLAAVAAVAQPVVAGGSVWVPVRTGVDRLDLRTGRLLGRVRLGGAVGSLAAGGGFAWALVLVGDGYRLAKIAPAAMRVVASRSVPAAVRDIAYGNGRVYLADWRLRVWRIDPRSLRVDLLARLPA